MADSLNSACGILVAFFGAHEIDGIVGTQRAFCPHLLPDIQEAAVGMLSRLNAVRTGLHQPDPHRALSVSGLLARCGAPPVAITPLQFHHLDLGEAEPFAAVDNALWLFRVSDRPVAVLLSRSSSPTEGHFVRIEVATLPDAASAAFAGQFLSDIQDAAARSTRYRGKILSLESPARTCGRQGMRIRRSLPVTRDAVILDDATMARLDRHVFAFDRHRTTLRQLGQSTRRSLLLYGPEGNGKTHVTRYIAANLPDRTTVLVPPEQTRRLADLMDLARACQPALVILEDVDRIRDGRTEQAGLPGRDGLRPLYAEMDRLGDEADILFLVTANHPRDIDPALMSRPGRIDEAIEIAAPDARCRTRLVGLFGASLVFEPGAVPDIVSRTEGVSVAQLKEMVRRLALASLMETSGNRVTRRSVAVTLGEATDSQTRIARRAIEGMELPVRRQELRPDLRADVR